MSGKDVGDSLMAMVHSDLAPGYLHSIDGAWARAVVTEFAFLEERGGTITDLSFHQKGDYIVYQGPWGSVTLEFMPENFPMGWIDGEADLHGDSASFAGQLDRLVRERAPGATLPSLAVMDEEAISANVRLWASVLRLATDLVPPVTDTPA